MFYEINVIKMKKLNRNINYLTIILLIGFLFTGCADVSPHVEDCITSNPYGFWGGLWHGITLPFSWIGSLISDDIAIYAYDNNGGWYDFGFALGAGAVFKGLGLFTKDDK